MCRVFLLFFLFLTGCGGCIFEPGAATVRELGQSVTRITTSGGGGTAWALDEHYLVTARHVCQSGSDIRARGVAVEVAFMSEKGDLCLLRGNPGLEPLGVRSRRLREGERIHILGFPNGAPRVWTSGRAGPLVNSPFGLFRQLSAPSHPGNSGGPVLDSSGRVVGMLVAGMRHYPHVTYSVTHDQLQEVIDRVR